MMRTKLADLIMPIAALGALTLGVGTAAAVAAPTVPAHHVVVAAAATPIGDGSGEGPNQ